MKSNIFLHPSMFSNRRFARLPAGYIAVIQDNFAVLVPEGVPHV